MFERSGAKWSVCFIRSARVNSTIMFVPVVYTITVSTQVYIAIQFLIVNYFVLANVPP